MQRTTVQVNVHSVRFVIDHNDRCTQLAKHLRCDCMSGSIADVKPYSQWTQPGLRLTLQEVNVLLHELARLNSRGSLGGGAVGRKLLDQAFYLQFLSICKLESIFSKNLDAIVLIWI